MLALCVDDEEILLDELERIVSSSPDVDSVVKFKLCSKALEWAQSNKPDIAFLDIQMRGIGGLELAKKLKELYEDLPVVFCTGYRDYAVDAFKLHVSGYLMKPVSYEDVQREIDVALKKGNNKKSLIVQCFGNFDVFYEGKPLKFKRKRSKEVFAFLVDRRGSSVTAKEICAALWEDDFSSEEKNLMTLYKLFGDLRETLSSVGAESVLIKSNQEYSVDTEKIDCDFYRYSVGDPAVTNKFFGEYMIQYSWAEETAAALQMFG